MSEPTTFGRRLKAFRLRAGLSQNQLPEKSGVHRPTISLLESGGQMDLSLSNTIKLADALGVSLDTLVRGDPLQSDTLAAV